MLRHRIAHMATARSNDSRLILAGGSGFLGGLLSRWFANRGHQVVVLSRHPIPDSIGVRFVSWDGAYLGDWMRELDGASALINLAGRSVNCRYTAPNRREILDSRLLSTRLLGQAIARCSRPPPLWLNASTATIYKHSLERPMDDLTGEIAPTPEAKDTFSIEVATAWEKEFFNAPTPATRKIALRTAMVLGHEKNSVLPVLRRLVRFGLGGKMASGRQFVSWIHQDDFCRAIEWLLDHDDLAGPVNLASPNPITNAELMRTLRQLYHMPLGLPATAWMLELGAFFLRTETELILKSRRVIPERLLASGFTFSFPHLREAVANLLHGHGLSPLK